MITVTTPEMCNDESAVIVAANGFLDVDSVEGAVTEASITHPL